MYVENWSSSFRENLFIELFFNETEIKLFKQLTAHKVSWTNVIIYYHFFILFFIALSICSESSPKDRYFRWMRSARLYVHVHLWRRKNRKLLLESHSVRVHDTLFHDVQATMNGLCVCTNLYVSVSVHRLILRVAQQRFNFPFERESGCTSACER